MEKRSTSFHLWAILFVTVALFWVKAYGQSPKGYVDLIKQYDRAAPFADVEQSVEKYFNRFANEAEKNRNGYKQWGRWAWFAKLHLDEAGIVSNWTTRNEAATMQAMAMPLAAAGPEVMSVNGSWQFIGPSTITNNENFLGRVECVAFHPSDANTFYVGTGTGGLWRTTNGGDSWTPLTDYLPSLSISGVVVQQNNPNIIYVLTGDGDGGNQWAYYVKERSSGVFRSTDGGITWQATGLNWNRSDAPRYGYKLIQSAVNPNLLIAATSDGIYRTTDGGNNWVQEQTGEYTDVVFRENNPDWVAAVRYGSSTLSKSDDGGETWTSHTIPNPLGISTTRHMLATSADRTDSLFILMGAEGNGNFRGLYRYLWSATGNNGFTLVTNTPNVLNGANDGSGDGGFAWWAIGIGVNRTNSAQVLVGGVIGRRSTNGGQTITAAHGLLHADIHGYFQNPLNNWVYCAHDGGISRSKDYGSTWTTLSAGLNVTQYYRISTVPNNNNIVLGGTQDNGHHVKYTNTSAFRWSLTCCDGMDNAINPDNPGIIYMSSQRGGLNRSVDSGKTWTAIRTNTSSWVAPILLHSTTPTTIFKAENSGIWRSTNSGIDGWVNLGTDGRGAIAQGVSNTNRFFAAGDNGTLLSRSNNINAAAASVIWTTVSGNTGWPSNADLAGTIITAIAVNPANADDVWVTLSGYRDGIKVLRSTNGGDTWSNISGSLPNMPVHTIKVRSMGGGNWEAYIGTDIGVFMRTNAFGWTYFSNSLPRVMVTDIELTDTHIFAGTYGRGIWRSALYANCLTSANYASTYSGERVFQASETITATITVTNNAGSNVWMQAGNYIQLNPGFHAQAGGIFTAKTSPCGPVLLPNVVPVTPKKEEED